MRGEEEISRGRARQEILEKKGLNAGKSVKGMELREKTWRLKEQYKREHGEDAVELEKKKNYFHSNNPSFCTNKTARRFSEC